MICRPPGRWSLAHVRPRLRSAALALCSAAPAGCFPAAPQAAGRGFMRPVWCPDSLYISAPYNPPTRRFTRILHKNFPQNLCKKTSPVPLKGGRGNGFGGLDGAKIRRYHSGQAEATRPAAQRTAAGRPGPGDQKGEVNMTTPNTGELLVQQAQEAERLRLLLLANECKDLDEFRQQLRALLNK